MSEFTARNPAFFYPSTDFGFLKPLSENWKIIRDELKQVMANGTEESWMPTFPEYVKSENIKAWKVFTFLFFGMKSPRHIDLAPKTAELVLQIPEIISCDFSFMEPKTHILPHKGYSRMVLRCHLPLIVPAGDCGIRVGDTVHQWKEGELVVFDDSFDHEAWNKTDEQRVVLMFDIPNPLWGYTAEEISRYKIEHIDDPFLLSFASREEWLKAFSNKVLPLG